MRLPTTGLAALTLLACASTTDPDLVEIDAMPGDGSVVASSCPAGEFAIGFLNDGTLDCAPIDAAALAAFSTHCSIYLGARDNCGGCTDPPAKWGRVSGADCANGAGADNTCSTADLGGVSLPLFGLNTDGEVDDNDKLYAGIQCLAPADEPVAGPCPEGSYLSGALGDATSCVTAQAAIAEYLDQGCDVYFGWRDSCDGCVAEPARWGRTSGGECTVGAGANSTCTVPALGESSVPTFGLNTGGTVNGDDKFYLGFQCAGAEASLSLGTTGSCPAGELVVGIDSQGNLECASPLPEAEAAVQGGCYLYFGWRDECNGCITEPAKWGRVSHGACENGAGLDNTCSTASLDGVELPLFGLNTDGDVDGNDKFYVGLACP